MIKLNCLANIKKFKICIALAYVGEAAREQVDLLSVLIK